VFKKLDYPLAPLVLALVLGDLAENALRQSLIMSQGSLSIFFVRPIAGGITAVAILFFLLPVITPWWRRMRGGPAPPPPPAGREPAMAAAVITAPARAGGDRGRPEDCA
jgi:hypothetical protein